MYKKKYICEDNPLSMKTGKVITAIITVAFLCSNLLGSAQDLAGDDLFDRDQETTPFHDFSLTAGSSFSSFSGAGGMFSSSISPRLNLDMTKDFHLEIGTIFSSSRITDMPVGLSPLSPMQSSGGIMPHGDGNIFSSTVYALGAYQVSPRLSVHGATWFERTSFDMMGDMPAMNAQATGHNPQGMMLGFDYKVTENLRFGAEVNVSTGYNPYTPMNFQQSPFGGFHNPSPFHRLRGW